MRLLLFRWWGVAPRAGHRDWLRQQLLDPSFPRRQVLGTVALLLVVDVLCVLGYRAATGELPPWAAQAGAAGAVAGSLMTLLAPEHARTRALQRAGFLRADAEVRTPWYRRRDVAVAAALVLGACLLVVAVSA